MGARRPHLSEIRGSGAPRLPISVLVFLKGVDGGARTSNLRIPQTKMAHLAHIPFDNGAALPDPPCSRDLRDRINFSTCLAQHLLYETTISKSALVLIKTFSS